MNKRTVCLSANEKASETFLGLQLPSMSLNRISEIKRIARRSLDFDSLRPGQEEAIRSIAASKAGDGCPAP
jgi:hypothetical protein